MSKKKHFNIGDIVLVPFPFSDLSSNKVRPALLLAHDKEDYTFIFITSVKPKGNVSVEILPSKINNLKITSYIRYTKFASLDSSIVLGKIGSLSVQDFKEIKRRIIVYLGLS